MEKERSEAWPDCVSAGPRSSDIEEVNLFLFMKPTMEVGKQIGKQDESKGHINAVLLI